MAKLTKDKIEKKIRFHERKVEYYSKKLELTPQIGFKYKNRNK